MSQKSCGKVIALSGGVGGAKLALGLSRILPAEQLIIVANTGDDFRHIGLEISPDIDTLLYTLSGIADPDKGWGRRAETWSFMSALEQMGGETWFQLGDGDLALHVERSHRLAAGETLTQVTARLRQQLGIKPTLLPMSDDRIRTQVRSDSGWLDFQDYFVRLRCVPAVREIRYSGSAQARLSPLVLEALEDERLRAVVICPSNPWLSIGPMLALPGLAEALAACRAPVIAVCPLIGGKAVKGPTVKLMQELDIEPTPLSVATYYGSLLNAMVIDPVDAESPFPAAVQKVIEPILMRSLDDRERVARVVLALADQLQQ